MTQDKKILTNQPKSINQLPEFISFLGKQERDIWVIKVSNLLIRGDLKHIFQCLKLKNIDLSYRQVQSVFNLEAFTPELGPLIIKQAVQLLIDRKENKKVAAAESTEFISKELE